MSDIQPLTAEARQRLREKMKVETAAFLQERIDNYKTQFMAHLDTDESEMDDRDWLALLIIIRRLDVERSERRDAKDCYLTITRPHRHLLQRILDGVPL